MLFHVWYLQSPQKFSIKLLYMNNIERFNKFEVNKFDKEQQKIPESHVLIETPKARFRIMYEMHADFIHEGIPETVPRLDAFSFDAGGEKEDYSSPEKAQEIIARWETALKEPGTNQELRKAIAAARECKKPIFWVDVSSESTLGILTKALAQVESVAGMILLAKLAREVVESLPQKKDNQNITRRGFLKKAGLALGGLYLSFPLLSGLVRMGTHVSKVDRREAAATVDKFLTAAAEKSHPEIDGFVLTFRNHLIAEKLVTISEIIESDPGKKPEIGIVMGGGHTGLEYALQKSREERLNIIKDWLPWVRPEQRDNISTIARLDFNENKNDWEATIIKSDYLSTLASDKRSPDSP